MLARLSAGAAMSEPCRCERADAITSLVASANATVKALAERDAALATIGRVRALCDSNAGCATRDGYLLVATIRAALEPTPKGTK